MTLESVENRAISEQLSYFEAVPRTFVQDCGTSLNNYRPISVLSVVIKILERAVFNQFYTYLVTNNLLSEHQSGFRQLHSTVTALLGATNEWYLNIDNGLTNVVLLVDLKKGF